MSNYTDRVIKIIAHQAVLEIEDVKETDTLEKLGIDSLGLVESIFAIEEEFDITVPYNANDPAENDIDLTTVKAVADAVKNLVENGAK
ncbi:MAG: phosphopantetheine-binding protein [Paracoccaceae bacterium]|nr:phosphopantetheine-binding protein [Paracoccaceae bacterium]